MEGIFYDSWTYAGTAGAMLDGAELLLSFLSRYVFSLEMILLDVIMAALVLRCL
jgi:hypothetical protein